MHTVLIFLTPVPANKMQPSIHTNVVLRLTNVHASEVSFSNWAEIFRLVASLDIPFSRIWKNKSTDQTACMRRLICACVVRMKRHQIF